MSADLRLRTPFNLIVAGPTGSGKTAKVANILRDRENLFEEKPQQTILYYRVWQPIYDDLLKEGLIDIFLEGMPDDKALKTTLNNCQSSCLIFDDLGQEINNSIETLFTVNSHHYNCSVILIVQNLFQKNKAWRTISLNCQYFVLTRNPRDPSQVSHLSSQIFPGKKNFLGVVCEYLFLKKIMLFIHSHPSI
jgi:hypothetical protein